jgi:hypothetical protein
MHPITKNCSGRAAASNGSEMIRLSVPQTRHKVCLEFAGSNRRNEKEGNDMKIIATHLEDCGIDLF